MPCYCQSSLQRGWWCCEPVGQQFCMLLIQNPTHCPLASCPWGAGGHACVTSSAQHYMKHI